MPESLQGALAHRQTFARYQVLTQSIRRRSLGGYDLHPTAHNSRLPSRPTIGTADVQPPVAGLYTNEHRGFPAMHQRAAILRSIRLAAQIKRRITLEFSGAL